MPRWPQILQNLRPYLQQIDPRSRGCHQNLIDLFDLYFFDFSRNVYNSLLVNLNQHMNHGKFDYVQFPYLVEY